MKHLPSILFAILTVSGTAGVNAQDLSGSITAVGEYKAEIRPHSRLSGLPQRLLTKVPEGYLPIATDAVEINLSPSMRPLTTGYAGKQLPESARGYLELRAGSYLDASLSAGYRFVDTQYSSFGAWLQHNSSSLYRPQTQAPAPAQADRKKLYDETISLYGSHTFRDAGMLSASATYHLGYFNYYNTAATAEGEATPAPSQTLNDFLFSVKWTDEHSQSSSGFFTDAALRYRYFGYRDMYLPYTEDIPGIKPTRENDVQLSATLGYGMQASGNITLDAKVRGLMYCNPHTTSDILPYIYSPFQVPCNELKSMMNVTLTPAYSINKGNWSLRAGARVDLTWGVSSPDQFSTFHIAPDVALSYAASKSVIYLRAGGGVEPNTLASLSELDMYQSPTLISTLPQYTPLHATLGLRLGDFKGFHAGLHVSYAISDNTPLCGWYPYWLHGMTLPTTLPSRLITNISLKGFSIGAEMAYQLNKILKVSGAATYQPQSGDTGWFNGIDRPRWTADLGATVSPLQGLAIGVTYLYRGVRNLILAETIERPTAGTGDHNFDGVPKYVSKRLPDIYDLGFNARYTLRERYTFTVAIDNILGSNSTLHPLMPSEGMMITGGVGIVF